MCKIVCFFFFFSSRRRHTRLTCDWSSDVCSSDLPVAQLCLVGAGGQGLGDLVPGVAVEPGIGDELGQEAFGLVDEAGDQGDGGQVVAGPGAAALSERGEGAVDQVVGVVAAARAGPGSGYGCLLLVVTAGQGSRQDRDE